MRHECEEIREAFSALLDGELSETRRKLVAAHLLVCPECSTEAGRVMAAKGLVEREEQHAPVPADFMTRLRAGLDQADGVRQHVRRSAPARRVTALAAAGAIAVSIAIILSTMFFMSNDNALALAQMHQQVIGMPGPIPGGGFAEISCNPSRDGWTELHRALMRPEGTLVTYTLYRVGSCPVSVFDGPSTWEPYRSGWRVTERIDGFNVRQVGDHSMTSWVTGGRRYVLIATAPPADTAALARVHASSAQGRSPGL
ncbi:MAG: hypothetical protein GX131_14080 [candidate division WS1 bacterium]|jgi:hypothetical protein|nr:hypothetical protein [candidate division WS1 bacterium]